MPILNVKCLRSCMDARNSTHVYLYGKHFVVESDHKPLEMIHLKNLSAAPARLQRMLLWIQPYDLAIRYLPGKDMLLADALSRSPSKDNTTLDLDISIQLVRFSSEKIQQLQEHTANDPELQGLKEFIIAGWPDRQKQLP